MCATNSDCKGFGHNYDINSNKFNTFKKQNNGKNPQCCSIIPAPGNAHSPTNLCVEFSNSSNDKYKYTNPGHPVNLGCCDSNGYCQ